MTLDQLRAVLSYNPDTGEFRWLVENKFRPSKTQPGTLAGYVSNGYRLISVYGKRYRSARLAWFYVTGRWPAKVIDHRNGDGLDDRLTNLREATKAQNDCNRRSSAKSGFKGVYKHSQNEGWFAEIKSDGRKYYLGRFRTIEEAVAARRNAAKSFQGEFAREN